ncbi:MAG: hypothetical protein A2Y75_01545 [Candidatus Solincola sediminis]|uniref:Uncharacterized protein n=1 Tax=Candidatus Solincola sediminis TaxID=1797199 RepID=A0A1F2WNN4_9ACTN|nr:MAG: hypothetical protein A2Y75_01545 [Candidatus Solincola sediminis]
MASYRIAAFDCETQESIPATVETVGQKYYRKTFASRREAQRAVAELRKSRREYHLEGVDYSVAK